MLTVSDFVFVSETDNLNFYKILKYYENSRIGQKLHGFVEKYNPSIEITEKKPEKPMAGLSKFLQEMSGVKQDENIPEPVVETQERPKLSSPLIQIISFIDALTNMKDGRVVIYKKDFLSRSSLKFLVLNPATYFADVLKDARAVIVAGGTMQPVGEFKDQLFYASGIRPDQILEYSCGHVIPPENLLPIALARGPSGLEFDFTYQSRKSTNMIDELGRFLINICNIVPGGTVVFFPSYDYEKHVYAHWERQGVLEKITSKKKIYREPKKANMVDALLIDYGKHIERCRKSITQQNGGILFSVVGGKMSEGINFSDDLGRCIVMVGLPYPNKFSPELQERMKYLDANMPKLENGQMPGQVHYENLCMKAVNQSIGRAIRHKGDYSSIILLDQRYTRQGTINKLSGWIAKHVQKMEKFGQVLPALKQFFSNKSTN